MTKPQPIPEAVAQAALGMSLLYSFISLLPHWKRNAGGVIIVPALRTVCSLSEFFYDLAS